MFTNLPRALRALRRRRGWRQSDLGRRAGLSRDVAQRAENGNLEGITVRSLDRLATALGATLVIELRWRGAELDALMDRVHASLVTAAAERVERAGWTVYPEVSFNHFGDRGRCDLIAWHAPTRTLVIIEVKSRIANLQETLGRLDVKVRLATLLAQELGLARPAGVVSALVLGEDGANRRTVKHHNALFRRFGLRGRAAFAWVRDPTRPV
ncbi:MAG TPA: helix-turn-helix transcriptional regulator, partial [Candidatus Limnocylindria bacterium]|nr:helix-turn-helix transcriptional regulator [Candidatus Limnocylindria bacterium]